MMTLIKRYSSFQASSSFYYYYSNDSNSSSKHMQVLNSISRNDAPNDSQNSKSTSDNDILNVKQAKDASKVEKIKSTFSLKNY
ncbi:hypothetical protein F8M41_000681 [Gigaspora margarita]|uniref:Uncharacterized protein n=1 Tax=Gigaspora margarita TaxID=4874 RepID=A0A8H3XH40_GIGMA|nr:hypothetical protein F8M41_000681 [Gigaspora margarita]